MTRSLIHIAVLLLCFFTVNAQPFNDEPCAAQDMPVYNSCFNEYYTTIDATITATPGRPSCQPASSGGDVWFSFEIPANGQVTVNLTPQNIDLLIDEVRFIEAAYYTGTCVGLTYGACTSSNLFGGPNSLNISEPAGTLIYLRVYDDDPGASSSIDGIFGLCITSAAGANPPVDPSSPSCVVNPPPSDDCASAPLIDNLDGYCGNTGNYTDGGGSEPSSANDLFCGSLENNSWLQFEASATIAVFYIHLSGCTSDFQARVFESPDCNTFIPKSNCVETTASTTYLFATDLTIGNTYYIMMDGYTGGNCDFTIGSQSGVVVSNQTDTVAVCENEILSVSVSNANITNPFELEYVLVVGGTTYGPNSTGNFDVSALGITGGSTGQVYAVNHDGTETFATWPTPVSTCIEYLERVVEVKDLPNLQVTASLDNICPATTVDLDDAILDADGGTLSYFTDVGLTSPVGDPSSVTTGTYYIQSANGDCSDVETVDVVVRSCNTDTTVCANDILTVTVSNANLTPPYVLEYVIVCGGTTYGPNSTGIFDLHALGITGPTCTVYAVNHDGNETFATWPVPVSACLETIDRTVIILPLVAGAASQSLCTGDSATINGADYYHSAGVYTDTISGHSCDSVVTLTITSNSSGGVYVASATDYHSIDPMDGSILGTVNSSPITTGWVNGSFTISQSDEKIYWLSDAFSLHSLDLNSGLETSIATAIGGLPFFWGMRYYNGHIYTITTAADNDKKLVRINPATGALDAGFAGIEINGTADNGFSFGSSPVIDHNTGMFYIPVLYNKLLQFDLINNTGRTIDLTGDLATPGFLDLLEINEYTGEMYALSNFSDVVSVTLTGPSTADVSNVKSLTSASGYANPISTFDPDRELYIFQAVSGCADFPIVAVDVNTGQEWCNDPAGNAYMQMEFLSCNPTSTMRQSIDKSEFFDHSNMKEVDVIRFDDGIKIYPNPTSSILMVETSGVVSREFVVSTLTGQEQYSGTLESEKHTIDLSSLPEGMYLLTIGNKSFRIVKGE